MADAKDLKPDAEGPRRGDDGAKSKSPDGGGLRAAKAGNAPGEKDAARRAARETTERKARWQAEDDRLARDAEERRARGQGPRAQTPKQRAARRDGEANPSAGR